MPDIANARVLIMATDGFEESELFDPRGILKERGAEVLLASLSLAPIQATVRDDPGRTIKPDMRIFEAMPNHYDALVIPGGVINPDALRMDGDAVKLVKDFARAGKVIAAICHGPWLLVEADLVEGKKVTGWRSIWTDLRNAGGILSHERVVQDGPLVTAQAPEDVEAFTEALISTIESA